MDHKTLGLMAGLLVIVSALPYCAAIIRKQEPERPNLVTWTLWTLIGFAVLVTYWSSGARESIWTAVFGFTNPILVVVLALRQRRLFGTEPHESTLLSRGKARKLWERLSTTERLCLGIGLFSLGMWIVVRDDPAWAASALYLALVADACAAIPTVFAHFKKPSEHPPVAWAIFALASFLNLFAVSEGNVATYAMPLYMCIGASLLTLPLVIFRLRNRSPLRHWY